MSLVQHCSRFITLLMCVFALTGCGGFKKGELEPKEKVDRATYHYNLAYGHYFDSTNKNVDASLQELLRSLEYKPDYPEAHFLAGLIYLGRANHGLAIRHFQTAIRLRPAYYAAKNNLGAAYLSEGRWDDAISVFQELVGEIKYATPGHGHNNLGWAWFKKGAFDKAEKSFRLALTMNPRLCQAYNNLGQVLFERGKAEQAEKYLRRGIKRCKRYAEPHFHLGKLYLANRKRVQALSSFDECVKLSGDSQLGDRCRAMSKSLGGQR
ncbi:MAG: tetratricopeptide repeat protein [Bradymonadia bacterium]